MHSMVFQSLDIAERMLAYVLIAPFIGGVLAGIDRKLTARLQAGLAPDTAAVYDALSCFKKSASLLTSFRTSI